jgi:hypothetical protein
MATVSPNILPTPYYAKQKPPTKTTKTKTPKINKNNNYIYTYQYITYSNFTHFHKNSTVLDNCIFSIISRVRALTVYAINPRGRFGRWHCFRAVAIRRWHYYKEILTYSDNGLISLSSPCTRVNRVRTLTCTRVNRVRGVTYAR